MTELEVKGNKQFAKVDQLDAAIRKNLDELVINQIFAKNGMAK